jgi:ParB family chromosome partitioning protein
LQREIPPSTGIVRIAVEQISRDPTQPRKTFDEAKLGSSRVNSDPGRDSVPCSCAARVRSTASSRESGAGGRLSSPGLHEVPAVVRDVTPAEAFELALVENLQRTDLNPLEEADGYRRLVQEFGLTQEQVGERVGRDRASVANTLRLLQLPDAVKDLLASGCARHGPRAAPARHDLWPELVKTAERIAREQLSVARNRAHRPHGPCLLVGSVANGQRAAPPRPVVEDLQRRLGTKVRLEDRGGKGTLEIDFFSYEDLERILALLRR